MTPGLDDLLLTWSPGAPAVTLTAAGAVYAVAARRTPGWPPLRSACFAAGLAVLAVALLSGIDAWSERLRSVHMVQHTLLLLVAPPLLAAGAPVTLALRRRTPGVAAALRHRGVRALGHPAVGFCALTATLFGVQLTGLYEAGLRDPVVHAGEHVAIVTAGLLFWLPIVGADPSPHRLGAVGRVGWLLAAMAPMGALSAVLISAGPADERAAGVVMWVGGGLLVTVAVLAVTGAALWQEETRMRHRETLGRS